jgi:hypothetical protein
MKRAMLVLAIVLAVASTARAQMSPIYVKGVVGANVSGTGSVLAGAEAGTEVIPGVDVFAELGWIDNMPTGNRNAAGNVIAAALSIETGQTTTFTARTPTVYGGGGARYRFAPRHGLTPYVNAAVGFAYIREHTKFISGGTDITPNLANLGVGLGTDLSGSNVRPTVGVGVGVLRTWSGWDLDGGYRYTRIFTHITGTNASRVYVEIGKHF